MLIYPRNFGFHINTSCVLWQSGIYVVHTPKIVALKWHFLWSQFATHEYKWYFNSLFQPSWLAFFFFSFLISLSSASKSKHSSSWAALSSPAEALATAPEPVPGLGTSARGCVTLAAPHPARRPPLPPGARALPELRWAFEPPPAQGRMLVHPLPRAQTEPSGICPPWAGWRRSVAGSAEHAGLQPPITAMAGPAPAPLGGNRGRRCSCLRWQLSPSPLPASAQIPREGQARTCSDWGEASNSPLPRLLFPAVFISSGCSCGFEHLMERNVSTWVFPGPPVCQCRPSWGVGANLGAEVVIYFPFLCFSQPLAVPAPGCACTPPSSLTFPPHRWFSMFSQRRSDTEHHAWQLLRRGSEQQERWWDGWAKGQSCLAGNKEHKSPVVGEHCQQHCEARMAQRRKREKDKKQSEQLGHFASPKPSPLPPHTCSLAWKHVPQNCFCNRLQIVSGCPEVQPLSPVPWWEEQLRYECCRCSESSSMEPVTASTRRIVAKAADAVKEKSCVTVLEGLKKFIGGKQKKWGHGILQNFIEVE